MLNIVPMRPQIIHQGYIVKKPKYTILLFSWRCSWVVVLLLIWPLMTHNNIAFWLLLIMEFMASVAVLCVGIWEKPRKVAVLHYVDTSFDDHILH